MNDKTGGNPGLRRAGTLAVVAAVAVLATGCGMVHVHAGSSGGSAPAGSATFRENLAFAHCMQTHGVPNFPTPKNSSQGFHISGHVNGNGFSGPSGRAYDACKQLLPRDSVTASSGHVTQADLGLALKVVQCLRTHGAPNFPDPTVVGGSVHFNVNIQSALFQAPLNACRSLLPKGFRTNNGTKLP
jgi:hypothetical protein